MRGARRRPMDGVYGWRGFCNRSVGWWPAASLLIGLQIVFFGKFRNAIPKQLTPSLYDEANMKLVASFALSASGVDEEQTEQNSVDTPAMMPMPHKGSFVGQWVHWVVVSHCSPRQLLQINMLLTSALAVGQPGNFTWILYGCRTDEQWSYAALHIPHPRCNMWRTTPPVIEHPSFREKYGHMVELGRSALVARWWKSTRPVEEAIGILNDDLMWLRPVYLKATPPRGSYSGPWQATAAEPMKAVGAYYNIGCVLRRFQEPEIRAICGEQGEVCLAVDEEECALNYASGPPWILHREDADRVFLAWPETAVRMHKLMNDGLAEQAAFGVAQMKNGVKTNLDAYWFLSAETDADQERGWNSIAQSKYDPCRERRPPPADEDFPPMFWACLVHEIPHLQGMGYRIHKNHIHADLLDCNVGLLAYPPRDALERYKHDKESSDFRQTWTVCMYTNVLNSYARKWKDLFCKTANVKPDVPIGAFARGFHEESGEFADLFPEGDGALPFEDDSQLQEDEKPASSDVVVKKEELLEEAAGNGRHSPGDKGQLVHWVFTTECNAYQFNQGNLLLASALHVDQPGEFTWIMVGCTTQKQKDLANQLGHPRARVWHTLLSTPIHPSTGKPYRDFQASNRPAAIAAWWRETMPKEEAVGILDPDEFFLRPVLLKENPRVGSYRGPWEAMATKHKQASAAYYGIGCIPRRFTENQLRSICGKYGDICARSSRDEKACERSYSSGPPWVLHRSDMDDVFSVFLDTAVRVHELWADVFSEQSAYGISQMQFGITSVNHPFWMLSAIDDVPQEKLWDTVGASSYDPCKERVPPPVDEDLPVLWHGCLLYVLPQNGAARGFKLHKDHVHKDLLDCNAPLIEWPPEDSLSRYQEQHRSKSKDFRASWSVCTFTNLINTFARHWKMRWCKEPNLKASYQYADYSAGFLNPKSKIADAFRRGGWSDASYKVT
eukprot:TRINITY_DN12267_c0_g1_i2.p1 TRINITY_DN12267_c0_g1~~TRINITY_DN12267_c0_g1_i2.p1  ORF type:complete len:953 (-),score=125.18 TRINITY_DN12267_c0_g1_i2:19-2877(-)